MDTRRLHIKYPAFMRWLTVVLRRSGRSFKSCEAIRDTRADDMPPPSPVTVNFQYSHHHDKDVSPPLSCTGVFFFVFLNMSTMAAWTAQTTGLEVVLRSEIRGHPLLQTATGEGNLNKSKKKLCNLPAGKTTTSTVTFLVHDLVGHRFADLFEYALRQLPPPIYVYKILRCR